MERSAKTQRVYTAPSGPYALQCGALEGHGFPGHKDAQVGVVYVVPCWICSNPYMKQNRCL